MMDAERKAEIRTRCDPSQRQPCRAYLEDVPDLLAAIDELTAENKELKLDLAAAEHYTTLCVKCRCAIDRVLALHQKVRSQSLCGDFCAEDGRSWPCKTVRALEP
jgi:hypothetical protein